MVNCNLQLSMDNGQLEIGKNRQLMILHNGVSGQTGVSEYIPGLFL